MTNKLLYICTHACESHRMAGLTKFQDFFFFFLSVNSTELLGGWQLKVLWLDQVPTPIRSNRRAI